jgi:hypothetical protein
MTPRAKKVAKDTAGHTQGVDRGSPAAWVKSHARLSKIVCILADWAVKPLDVTRRSLWQYQKDAR